MKHKEDEILNKYLNGEIDTDQEKYKILELDKELIKTCEGLTLLTLGEMTLVVGGKNSGKSKFVNHIIKQVVIDNCDTGFVLSKSFDYKVVTFDSEMGTNRLVQWSIKSSYEDEYGVGFLNDKLKGNLFIYSLKRISPGYRVDYIDDVVKGLKNDYPNSHFLICLDVGTCLTSDMNSSTNAGVIDNLIAKLGGCTLIVTIHHSLKDESKNGIGMGSIGTALEKYCAIKLLVNPTDNQKRHRVEFLVSKYEDIDKEKDYFYIHTEKDTEGKIHISGISDSLGQIIRKKGNSKVDDENFKIELIGLIKNSINVEDRLQKNIIPFLMNKFNIGSSSAYAKISKLKKLNIIKENDGELFIN